MYMNSIDTFAYFLNGLKQHLEKLLQAFNCALKFALLYCTKCL